MTVVTLIQPKGGPTPADLAFRRQLLAESLAAEKAGDRETAVVWRLWAYTATAGAFGTNGKEAK